MAATVLAVASAVVVDGVPWGVPRAEGARAVMVATAVVAAGRMATEATVVPGGVVDAVAAIMAAVAAAVMVGGVPWGPPRVEGT